MAAKRSGKSARRKERGRGGGRAGKGRAEGVGRGKGGGGWRRTCARISRVRSTSY